MDAQTSDTQTSPPATERFPNKRISAFLIDLLFIAFVSLFLLGDLSNRMVDKGLVPASLIFEGLYLLLRDGLFRGQSLGKLAVGIQVVDLSGRPCNLWRSILRNLIFVLPSAITYAIFSDLVWMLFRRLLVLVYLIEYLVLRFSPEGRRLGDRLAKTRVIDTRPHLKDFLFLWISLPLLLLLAFGVPSLQLIILKKQADSVVKALEEHKKTHHGFLPEKLEELKIKPNPRLNFTRYLSHHGSPEFYLTGINAPFPNFSYSSERKEWRLHKGGMAWNQEEMGINETTQKAQSHYQRGIDFENQNAFDLAIEEYREAIRLFPNFISARLTLAELFMKQEKLDEALSESEAIVKLEPESAQAHLNRFLVFYRQKRFAEAFEAHQTFLRLDPPLDEEARKHAGAMTQYLEEQIRLGTKPAATSVPSSIPPKPEDAIKEVEKEVRQEPQKIAQDLFQGLKSGDEISVRLKNGASVKGRFVSKDSRGLWLEMEANAKAYFTVAEIQQIERVRTADPA